MAKATDCSRMGTLSNVGSANGKLVATRYTDGHTGTECTKSWFAWRRPESIFVGTA